MSDVSDGISIKMESIIKLEPEMLLLSNEFRLLKEEVTKAKGEDSVVASSSDETSTDTGSNHDSIIYIPFPLTDANEDSGHEGTPNDLESGKNSKSFIRNGKTVRTGDRGSVCSSNGESKGSGREERPEEPEVFIIEERVCKGHWRDGNGRVARTRCTCCYMCSTCGTSILRRRDFMQHVASHRAKRPSDRWRLQVKRVRQDRRVRSARATPKALAERTSPKLVARHQPSTTSVAMGRVRGGYLPVHLDDERESESAEADGDIPRQTQLSVAAERALQKPPSGEETPISAKLKEVRVVLERLEEPIQAMQNPSVAKPRDAEGAKTSERVACEKQPQSDKQAEAGGHLSHITPADPNASTVMEEMPKTLCLSYPQDDSEVITVRLCLASGSTLSNENTVTEDSTTMQLQSHAQPVAGMRVLRKSHATECATCNADAKKKQPQSHKRVANPQTQVQLEVGRVPLEDSQAVEGESSSAETIENVASKTPLQSHAEADDRASRNELTAEKNPREILVANKSQADGVSKAAETKETNISKTQTRSQTNDSVPRCTIHEVSPFSSSAETSQRRSQRARELLSNGFATSGETSSTAPRQLQTQKIGAIRKPQMVSTVSSKGAKEQALMRTRFQSQRTSGSLQSQKVARGNRTSLGEKVVEGSSQTIEKVVTQTQGHLEAVGRGRNALKRPAADCCDAVAEEGPPKSRRVAHKVVGTFRRPLRGQNALAERSGKAKKNVPIRAQPQIHAKTRGALATRKRYACDSRSTANEQSSLELNKMTDATERTCPVQTAKTANVISNSVAGNEEVLPKIQSQSPGQSVAWRRKRQASDISAPSSADAEVKLVVTLDTGERVVLARQSQASEAGSEKSDGGRPTKKVRTRLQSHMQADEENGVFRCSFCKATFPDAGSLRPHVESHRYWEETFYCDVCQRRFSGRAYLALHVNASHKEEKPFACDQCDRRFALRSYLAMHVRSHVKPFGCGACGKRFARASSLHVHVRSHAKRAGGKRRRKRQ